MLDGGFLNWLSSTIFPFAELGEHIFNRQWAQFAQRDSTDVGIDHLQLSAIGSQRTGCVFALAGEPALCVVLKGGAAVLTEAVLEAALQLLGLVHDVLTYAPRSDRLWHLDSLRFADLLTVAVAVADGDFVLTLGELLDAGHQ